MQADVCCVALGEAPHLSKPQGLHLYNENPDVEAMLGSLQHVPSKSYFAFFSSPGTKRIHVFF